jgi:hypothetical protein
VILHGVLLSRLPGRKGPIICSFCHKEKQKKPVNTVASDSDRLQRLNADLPALYRA